jgi:threonine dehydrogenase-like Zn-dependent dehydrogenase
VHVVEPIAARRDLAMRHGALGAHHPEDAESALHAATGGLGPDLTIESAGTTSALASALRLTRPGGTVALLGVNSAPFPATPLQIILKELTIVSSLSHTMADFQEAVQLLESGDIDPSGIVTDRIPLARAIADGFTPLRDHPESHIKIVILPGVATDEKRAT